MMSSDPRRNERRLFARARVGATATAWVRGLCKGSYIVENLSWGGTYLSGGPAIRQGEDVKLILELPRGPIEVRGLVLRSEAQARDAAIAVRFDDPSRRVRDAIGAAVGEALERAARDSSVRPEPTVLVIDDSMIIEHAGPSSARDLLSFLADEKPAIRRVLMSEAGRRLPEDLEGPAARVDAVLAKPWDRETLARTMQPAGAAPANGP